MSSSDMDLGVVLPLAVCSDLEENGEASIIRAQLPAWARVGNLMTVHGHPNGMRVVVDKVTPGIEDAPQLQQGIWTIGFKVHFT